jgi:hypothetical protein
VEDAEGKAYGKATGLYNKHRKYSEQWNPWHTIRSTHDVQQAQSFRQQTKSWIEQLLRHGLENYKIESFQSAGALQNLLSELDVGLSNESQIEDNSHICGTLYYRDNFKSIQFLLAHLPFQEHLDFDPEYVADSECCQIYREMNTGKWWWDTPDQLPTGATIVPFLCACNMTNLSKILGDQHIWLLYLTIGNI